MTIPNANVQAELSRQDAEWAAGVDEGRTSNLNVLPAWWFDRPCSSLTTRQRGYWLGRELELYGLKWDKETGNGS